MFDRVVILHKGRIVAQGKPNDLKRKLRPGATLEDVFLSIVGSHPGATP